MLCKWLCHKHMSAVTDRIAPYSALSSPQSYSSPVKPSVLPSMVGCLTVYCPLDNKQLYVSTHNLVRVTIISLDTEY